ncbi:DNA-binding protein [Weeksellaceae bacterium KMM 9713]|uniref:DNA-binding protein n=1 Tax=Profundicola chukchiensis TaxID=2961959 RepID=A0A9X4MXE1_9FLAO|nr:HU family DNA-binding protein [Profundicola chukchiensis]MDG4945873.1 DNA-binding protein [Profundicola chukchiensis]MDG4951267.1 DNA-binding protein [Profundicola chukchiensis]
MNIHSKLKVPLVIQERQNPQDRTEPAKFYLQAVKSGNSDLRRLAYLISIQSTVRQADCLAVLDGLVLNMMDELAQGRAVQLGDLGTFQVAVSSSGSVTPEEVNQSNIRRTKLNYRPSMVLKKWLKTLEFSIQT